MEKTITFLLRHYYVNIILLAIITLLVLLRIVTFFQTGQTICITLERYAIMVSIIAIPGSLKYFSYRLKKMSCPLETVTAIKKYKNVFFLRQYTLSVVTMMHIVLFAFSRNMNFLWFTVVLFIVFLFCKPSYAELEKLTETPEEKNIPKIEGDGTGQSAAETEEK